MLISYRNSRSNNSEHLNSFILSILSGVPDASKKFQKIKILKIIEKLNKIQ